MADVRCKVCDVGALERKQVRRMSAIVVLIGYVILAPSVLGIVVSLIAFYRISTDAAISSGAGAVSAVMSIGFALVFLVGGLLGWLLIMKKQILQCNNCGAVIAAS